MMKENIITERDILMAVKGMPKQIVFITSEEPVTKDIKLNFIVDDTLTPYINGKRSKTDVFFTWNDSKREKLDNGETIFKTASQVGTDTYTLEIQHSTGDDFGDNIGGKTGTIIVR